MTRSLRVESLMTIGKLYLLLQPELLQEPRYHFRTIRLPRARGCFQFFLTLFNRLDCRKHSLSVRKSTNAGKSPGDVDGLHRRLYCDPMYCELEIPLQLKLHGICHQICAHLKPSYCADVDSGVRGKHE